MGDKINRAGRGEALRKLLQRQNLEQPPPEPEPQEAMGVQRPPAMAGMGRSAFFARLLSDLDKKPPQTEPEPKVDTASSTPQEALPRRGFGRAKLMSRMTSSPTSLKEESQPSLPKPVTSLEKSMSKLSVKESASDDSYIEPVVMLGSSGTKIDVVCNYIRLKVEQGKGVFQYDVRYSPEVDSKHFRFELLKTMQNVIGEVKSFDGHVLYLPFQLPKTATIGHANLPSDNSPVTITITFVKKLYTGHREMIHLYNLLFRKIMHNLGLVLHGQHYFDPKANKSVPAHKLEIWPGYITSIQDFEGGLMLCCDASHRVLRTQTVHQYMKDIMQLNRAEWKEVFINAIVGNSVLTRYNNKIYRVDDIDFDHNPQNTFPYKDGSQMSYANYYEKQYNIKITDYSQPLLKSRVKSRIKGQPEMALVDLIPELCYLSGLTDEMRADMRVMKDVAQYTRISPGQRQYALREFIRNINSNSDTMKLLSNWGLSLENDSIPLQGRVLMPEDIYFGNNAVHKGNHSAEWSKMASQSPVLTAIEIRHWIIVCTHRDERKINEFVQMVMKCAPQIGIKVFPPRICTIQNDSTQNYICTLHSELRNETQITVIVFPNARVDKYSAVKKLCCIDKPVPSQVIQTRTISRQDKLRSITQKILLQMNCKLGGTLWSVKMPVKSTIVIGLDTFHDTSRKSSSIGAVVASLNTPLTRWYSKIYKQLPGVELIDGLEICLLSCLQKFREINGFYPEQIILYRDGVGDGDLTYCRDHEIPQIISAFNRISPDYNPKFLVVIVQKRINTRIFATERNDFSNPPPGTIIDHTVCRRNFYDFFLVAQNVRQGTVTPTHYVVIYNTTNMLPDHVQRLSFKLTHMYYNWCGTVRVPAPCQYAHKLASLVGESLHKEPAECLNDKLFFL